MSAGPALRIAMLMGLATACRAAQPGEAREAAEARPGGGRVIHVAAGGDLQAALDTAQPGDTVTLAAGATFGGPFTLPDKPGADWITIRGDGELPAAGTRVGPSQAEAMPKLEAEGNHVIRTAPGAHHYRLVGLEIRPRTGEFVTNVVQFGVGESSPQELPHDLAVERCYVHGDPTRGSRRGIALNSRETTIVDSYISDFKEVAADSQAIAGWNGPGPFRIENNYLEGAGENLMFGGADPSIADLVPADITVRRNHMAKPLSWKRGEAGYAGTRWSVKNLFELKNARRVVVEDNLFEHNWVDAQSGFAILFTVRNQDGRSPWSTVEDVTFADNVVRHSASGVNVLGFDDNHRSGQTRRVTIRNNLFDDIGGERWGGGGRLLQLLDRTADVVFEHNTGLQASNLVTADGRPHTGFVFRNNIALHNDYGVVGSGSGSGNATLQAFFPGAQFVRNVIVGGAAGSHPADNFFPTTLDQVGFVDGRAGNYRLREGSPYKRAGTDGRDLGADIDALAAALAAARP